MCIAIRAPNSNLPLQVFLTFETYYSIFYTMAMFAITFYKGYGGLLFPDGVWGMELFQITVFFLMQMLRLDHGKRSNRNENAFSTLVFVLFTFMSILFYVYLALGTTYVLIIDMGFGLIGVFFAIIEFFFGLVAYI